MALRGVEFTSSGTFTVPASVTSLWITAIGPGGGGAPSDGTSGGAASGGGSGEFTGRCPIKVTPGDVLTVTIGPGGTGGSIGDTHGGDATTPTSITSGGYTISCQGGFGGAGNNSGVARLQPPSNDGGGTGGYYYGSPTGPIIDGYPGIAESNCFFGGSIGGGQHQVNGGVGRVGGGSGPWAGGPGGAAVVIGDFAATGGGGGASSIYGIGAAGGDANHLTNPTPIPPNAVYWGTAGGGTGGWCTNRVGGDGAKGYLLVQWCG